MAKIPQKSKAAVIVEWGKPLQIREYPIPEVESGGILVKVEVAGICGSDVHQWHGRIPLAPRLPQIPGHEVLGRIVKLGKDRTYDDATGEPLKIGDRIMWAHIECGKCYWCKIAHQPTLCPNRTYYALRYADEYPQLMGGFAEYEYVIPSTNVIRVPDELTEEEVIGAGCAFRTVIAAFERFGGLRPQDDIVIQGAGPIGLYSLVLALEGGARKSIVVGAPQKRLDLAKKWGATDVINIDEIPDSSQRRNQILDLTDGRGPDVVVEASGVPVAFNEGLEMVRKGGRYLVIGQSSAGVTIPIAPAIIMYKGLDIVGSLSGMIRHFHTALQFIMNKRAKYTFADIVTNKYSLEQANDAL